jgi:hypothetical protein
VIEGVFCDAYFKVLLQQILFYLYLRLKTQLSVSLNSRRLPGLRCRDKWYSNDTSNISNIILGYIFYN